MEWPSDDVLDADGPLKALCELSSAFITCRWTVLLRSFKLQNTRAVNAQYAIKNRAGVALAKQQSETQAALQSFAATRQAQRNRHAEEQRAAVASAIQPLNARLAELAQELEAAHKKTEAAGTRGIFSETSGQHVITYVTQPQQRRRYTLSATTQQLMLGCRCCSDSR